MSTLSNPEENERSIWGDDDILGDDDELVIIRSADLDDAPIPERVPDLPARNAPRRFSETIEENDDYDAREWTPEGPVAPQSNPVATAIDTLKIALGAGALIAVIGGLALILYLAASQYGVI